MKFRHLSSICFPLFLLLILISASVFSLPRLAVEQELNCITCHLNPGGGGMRNEFGNYTTALNELTLQSTKKLLIKKYRPPRLSDNATFGFDSRYLLLEDGTLFRMQTDFYLALEPLDDFYYYFRFSENGISEQYALFGFKKFKYYFKAGRFSPEYGLGQADHKSFVRERTGHGSNVYLDGIEVGGEFGGFSISSQFFNPLNQGLFYTQISKPGKLWHFSYLAGASLRISEEEAGSYRTFQPSKGLFGGVSYDRFTLMGEIDWVGKDADTLITYLSLTSRVVYGAYLIGEYNFFEPDRHSDTFNDEFYRLSFELFPIPFVEIRPSYTRYTGGALKGEDSYFVQFHIGY